MHIQFSVYIFLVSFSFVDFILSLLLPRRWWQWRWWCACYSNGNGVKAKCIAQRMQEKWKHVVCTRHRSHSHCVINCNRLWLCSVPKSDGKLTLKLNRRTRFHNFVVVFISIILPNAHWYTYFLRYFFRLLLFCFSHVHMKIVCVFRIHMQCYGKRV